MEKRGWVGRGTWFTLSADVIENPLFAWEQRKFGLHPNLLRRDMIFLSIFSSQRRQHHYARIDKRKPVLRSIAADQWLLTTSAFMISIKLRWRLTLQQWMGKRCIKTWQAMPKVSPRKWPSWRPLIPTSNHRTSNYALPCRNFLCHPSFSQFSTISTLSVYVYL